MDIGILIFIVIIASLLGGVLTFVIFRQEERQMKKYEEEGDTAASALERSLDYEKKSLSSNVRNLSWIYTIVIVFSFIGLAIYIYQL